MPLIVADAWYRDRLDGLRSIDDWIDRRPGVVRRVVNRFPSLRGIALAAAARRADAVLTTNGAPGATLCIAICGLLGVRKLILLEYIPNPPVRGTRLWVLRVAYFTVLRRILLARCLLVAQVMTAAECAQSPATHRIPARRFAVVRYPSRFDNAAFDTAPGVERGACRVLASGRRADWATVFDAARGTDWDLRIVCRGGDLDEVRALDQDSRALVRSDISAGEHQEEVAAATVFVIAVPETGASIGQMRVMNAYDAGTPIVASDVAGLREYVTPDTAVLVPPGDPDALRAAVDDLLTDPAARAAMAAAGRAQTYRMTDYETAIRALIADAVAARAPGVTA